MELIVDFFHYGVSTLVSPGQRVMILLPGSLPGSMGDLPVKALARFSVAGIVHGAVRDPVSTVHAVLTAQADCLVGIPVQILALVCREQAGALAGKSSSVLLSTDYVPDALVVSLWWGWAGISNITA